MPTPEKCGLKDCSELMGPGSSAIGFVGENDKLDEVRVCAKHTWQIMMAPRGSFRIEPDKSLKALPASPKIII
jgi:hypothetical protein